VKTWLALAAVCVACAACDSNGIGSANDTLARQMTGGDPVRGREQIHNYGCDSCHTIPGVLTATATVGPPLTAVGRRSYLAGRLQNTPENMMRWISHPHSIDEHSAMPETGVTDRDVRDIVAYLYTLR
jgi:cytochrome c1